MSFKGGRLIKEYSQIITESSLKGIAIEIIVETGEEKIILRKFSKAIPKNQKPKEELKELRSKEIAWIEEILVCEGKRCKAGEVVARIKPPSFFSSLEVIGEEIEKESLVDIEIPEDGEIIKVRVAKGDIIDYGKVLFVYKSES